MHAGRDRPASGRADRASRVDTKAWGKDFNTKDQAAWEDILKDYQIDL